MKTTLIPPLSQSGWQHPFVKSFTQTSALFRPCWEISLLPLFWILCALCSPVQSPSKVSLQPSYLHQGRCFCVKSFECSSSTAPGFLFLVVLTEHCDIQPALLIYIYLFIFASLLSPTWYLTSAEACLYHPHFFILLPPSLLHRERSPVSVCLFKYVHSLCWLQAEKARQELAFNINEDLEQVCTGSPIQTETEWQLLLTSFCNILTHYSVSKSSFAFTGDVLSCSEDEPKETNRRCW